MVGLECFLDVVRALGMGNCLTAAGDGGDVTTNSSLSFTVLTASSTSGGTGSAGGGGGGEKRRKKNHGLLRKNSSSLEFKGEEMIRRVAGRMFVNGVTDVACLFTKQGKKGVNQDAMVVWENFGSRADTIFCGIFDGHGPYGHMVAKRVRDILPVKLSTQWALSDGGSKDSLDDIDGSAKGIRNSGHGQEDQNFDGYQALKESFLKAFKVMDKELKIHPNIDCYYSGTTAVTLVKQGHNLVIGNVGDSRAVLGTRDEHNSLVAVQLTVDLKPNLPREEERIRRCKGRVFALRNEPEVTRVWLPNSNSPGLAMARAFGDFCLKDFGLIAVPEICYHRITDKDAFVVLATDGIWDVLSNKEVVDIVASASQSSAARILVETAVRAWRYKYPTSKVDDCAVVCLYFNSNSYYSCSSTPKPEAQTVKNL